MTEEFALRLWQEQVDSQPMIERLVNGEIRSLTIRGVDQQGDDAILDVAVTFADGASSPGEIGLRRFGESWYVAYATAERDGTPAARTTAPLPALGDVDVQLLSAIIAEQQKSRSVLDEYVEGIVTRVDVVNVAEGPSTATIDVAMTETHEDATARLVAIRQEHDGEPRWFLARFAKTGEASTTD
jgi:hypothetical protein